MLELSIDQPATGNWNKILPAELRGKYTLTQEDSRLFLDNNMKKEQIETLGFIPQKDIVYNKLLPYADKLDDESNEILAKIKANLGRSVQLRELWPGAMFWTRKLAK